MENKAKEIEDKRLEDVEGYEDNWSKDGWVLIIIFMLVFGWGGKDPKFDALEDRVSRLEAKNEIIEKVITK